MTWKVRDRMSVLKEFIALAVEEGANITKLCRQFGISRKTGYKWLNRWRESGEGGLLEKNRRPGKSPKRTAEAMERRILAVREQHPTWGARKIKARLGHLGVDGTPSASTVHEILVREGKIDPAESAKRKPFQRFERERPNSLWQMDFKGDFPLPSGRCHPLTVLDDHSRFNLGLAACSNQRTETVQGHLTGMFRQFGLPDEILCDNGAPWGDDAERRYTRLEVWLLRLGIWTTHGRPYHPQTQGKEERFHRTLKQDVLRGRQFDTLACCQAGFDHWREVYNHQRPHQAIGMCVPASRFSVSEKAYPEMLRPIEYPQGSIVRKVDDLGFFSLKGNYYRLGRGFAGQPIALLPAIQDGVLSVRYCQYEVAQLNLLDHSVRHIR